MVRSRRWRGFDRIWAIAAMAGLAASLTAMAGISLSQPAAALVLPTKPATPASPLVQVDVIGTDERILVPERHRKTAESIGLLWQRGSGHACSAFCVGDGVIATNAHCVVRLGNRKARNLQLFRFVLAPEEGPVTADHISTLLFAAANQPNLSFYSGAWRNRRSLDAMVQDWAFAKLAKPICRGKALRFVGQSRSVEDTRKATTGPDRHKGKPPIVRTPHETRADRLFMIAYHGDRDLEQRWYAGNCQREPSKRRDLIFHTCDTFKGSSGAPVMRMRDGEPEVVAINVGTYAHERYRYARYRTRFGRVRRKRQIVSQSIVNVGVKPRGFVKGLARFKREYLLSSLSEFRDVQIQLRAERLYRGRIDGIFGKRTRRAIIEFERSRGLAPIGMPTRRLLNELRGRQTSPGSAPFSQDLRRPGS